MVAMWYNRREILAGLSAATISTQIPGIAAGSNTGGTKDDRTDLEITNNQNQAREVTIVFTLDGVATKSIGIGLASGESRKISDISLPSSGDYVVEVKDGERTLDRTSAEAPNGYFPSYLSVNGDIRKDNVFLVTSEV